MDNPNDNANTERVINQRYAVKAHALKCMYKWNILISFLMLFFIVFLVL